ncbi:Sensory transduction protein kinase [Synechocystis sp. PCC 6714]|nr:Sensory transduction protein kinase [Synechocystis sp. PCC 6714]
MELVCHPPAHESVPPLLAERLGQALGAAGVVWVVGQGQPWFWCPEKSHGRWPGGDFWQGCHSQTLEAIANGRALILAGEDWPELQEFFHLHSPRIEAIKTSFQRKENGWVIMVGDPQTMGNSARKNQSFPLQSLQDSLGVINQLLLETDLPKDELLENFPMAGIYDPGVICAPYMSRSFFEKSPILRIWYEASRQQLEQQKQWNENLINNIVTTMSDQTRNPLANIRMVVATLRTSTPTPEKLAQRLAILEQEWHKLNEINGKILQLRQLKQEQNSLQLQDFDAIPLLKKAIHQHQWEKKNQGIAMEFHCPGEIYLVKADSVSLGQIFQELLINAQKFAPASSVVTITIDNYDQTLIQGTRMVKFTFSNQTNAMDNKNLEYLFDPFYREQWVIDSAIAGIGLGLTIVRTLIEQLNGKISVVGEPSSQPGQSVITFTLMIPGSGATE